MTPLRELYEEFVREKTKNASQSELDCLLHPRKYPVVWKVGDCSCDPGKTPECQASCLFNAIKIGSDGKLSINEDCVGCSACIDACQAKKLIASKDILPAMKAVLESDQMVYALVAPAFIGQFSPQVTPGTVSYTHLDVYKRQPYSNTKPFRRFFRQQDSVFFRLSRYLRFPILEGNKRGQPLWLLRDK